MNDNHHAVSYFFDIPARLAHIDNKGRPAFIKDVDLWMNTTCKGFWFLTSQVMKHHPQYRRGTWDGIVYRVTFDSERDATLFKLFWL